MVGVSRRSSPGQRTPVRRYASVGRRGTTGPDGLTPLVRQLSDQGRRLIRSELELAKVEVSEKAKVAGVGVGMVVVAVVLALGMLGALTATAILALALVLPGWLAALIVTGIYALLVIVAALAGLTQVKKAVPLVPRETVESLKEDIEWLKTELRSARR